MTDARSRFSLLRAIFYQEQRVMLKTGFTVHLLRFARRKMTCQWQMNGWMNGWMGAGQDSLSVLAQGKVT